MISCTASHNIYSCKFLYIFFFELNATHIYAGSVFRHTSFNKLLYYSRLFVYFFNHKMLVSAFFSCIYIPFYLINISVYFFFAAVVYLYAVSFYYSYFIVIKEIYISCVMKNSRYIRCYEVLAFTLSYYKGCIFSCGYNGIRIITADNAKGICSFYSFKHF